MALKLPIATNLAMPAQKWNQELASQLIILPFAGLLIQSFARSPDQVSQNGQNIIHYGTFSLKSYIVGARL